MKKLLLSLSSLFFILLTNSQTTTFQWAKGLGGIGNDEAFAIKLDASGNIFVTGNFTGKTDFDPGSDTFYLTSAGSTDIFILKLNASGNFVWAKKLGGPATDEGTAITLDAQGNIYTTGYFQGTADFDPGTNVSNLIAAGGSDIFVSKLNASGDFIWAKSMGGTSTDQAFAIAVDVSENIYTTGIFLGTADFDPGTGTANFTSAGFGDVFISKLDASGNFAWAKQLKGSSTDFGSSLVLDGSGNIFSTGYFTGTVDFDPSTTGLFNLTSANNDIFILKLDASGNFTWAKKMGSTGIDVANCIALDALGNIYTTGQFESTADFDPNAGVFNLTVKGQTDIFICKLNANGNFIWAKQMGGPLSEFTYALVVDASGSVYVSGDFLGTCDFDPGSGTFNLTSAGYSDLFIAKLDSSGNFAWAKGMGSAAIDDGGYGMAVDASRNVFTTGTFEGTCDFDPGTGTYSIPTFGGKDIFIHKMHQTGTGFNTFSSGILFEIYPNPSTGIFHFKSPAAPNNSHIEIYNSFGLRISSKSGIGEQDSIDLTDQSAGLYLVKVFDNDNNTVIRRILKTE